MSSIKRKIAISTVFQFSGKIISTLLGLVSVAMITRHLGVEGYGQYATAITFVGIFSIVADMGLYIYVVREISQKAEQTEGIVSNVFTFRIISALALLALAPLSALFFPYGSAVQQAILISTLSFFFISLNQVLIGVFQRDFNTKMVAVGEIVGRAVLVVALALVVWWNLGLTAVIWALIFSSAVNFFLVFFSARRRIKIRLRFDWRFWKEILKVTWPIAISVVLNAVYFKLDMIFLSVMKSEYEVGLYGEAYKILEVLIAFPAMFAGLLMPLLSQNAYTNWPEFKKIIRRGFDFLIMVALPIVVAGGVLAQPIVVFVGGPEFVEAAPILRILVIATAMIFLGNLFTNAVVAVNRQKQMVWMYLLTSIAAVIMYRVTIPLFSYLGAAWSTVAVETLMALLAFLMVWKTSRATPSWLNFIKFVLAAAVMAGILIVGASWWNWDISWWKMLLLLIAGLAGYATILLSMGAVKKRDLKEIFHKSAR